MRFHLDRYAKDALLSLRQGVRYQIALRSAPEAAASYHDMRAYLSPRGHTFDIIPSHNILYVPIQKNATSLIRRTLSEIGGMKSYGALRKVATYGNPMTMEEAPVADFYRILQSPEALRFAFVRNPYDRLVSAWASKFKDQPLVPSKNFSRGHPEIDTYLRLRKGIDPALPHGGDEVLPFDQFVDYATAISEAWEDPHIQNQTSMIEIPGLTLNYLGRFESFQEDIGRILDHGSASTELRKRVLTPINRSERGDRASYYTDQLRDKVFSAYRRDFETFGYS